MVVHALITALGRLRQVDLFEFLVCKASSKLDGSNIVPCLKERKEGRREGDRQTDRVLRRCLCRGRR